MTSNTPQSRAQSNLISVIFLHHSTGANLMKDGNVRKLFQQRAPFIAFWDHGYNPGKLRGKFAFITPFQSEIHGLRDATGRVLPTSYGLSFVAPLRTTHTQMFKLIELLLHTGSHLLSKRSNRLHFCRRPKQLIAENSFDAALKGYSDELV